LIVRNTQAPGDIIVLSAAIRDLAIAHPNRYRVETWVSKGAEHIFWNSPYVVKAYGSARPDGRNAVMYKAEYPLIKTCNQQRKHFILGFIEHMNKQLGTKIKLTEFRPSIFMSDEEKKTRPFEDPYWIFLSGGKKDFPTKIWAQSYWQRLIDMTRDRVNWVQCGGGSSNHIMHAPKRGIYANMVAKTHCRNFLRLIYHAEGVVCATTMAMHAAAAFNKPCVVIEGGREPWWWEAYDEQTRLMNMRLFDPGWSPPAGDDFVPHRYLHTIGQLSCCRNHGCWKKRVVGGGSVCASTVSVDGQVIPKCKSLITPEMVEAAIDGYLQDGVAREAARTEVVHVPRTTMTVPSDERPAAQIPPSEPPPVAPAPRTPPADLRDVRFCLYGEGTIDMDGPSVSKVNHGTPRGEALQGLLKRDEKWLVWIERDVQLHQDWLDRLLPLLTTPAVVCRAYRTQDGTVYPCPSFFAVHKELVCAASEFERAFSAAPNQYRRLGDVAKLPARTA
jgi:ADP-heptose:LPS heptosyltransferase